MSEGNPGRAPEAPTPTPRPSGPANGRPAPAGPNGSTRLGAPTPRPAQNGRPAGPAAPQLPLSRDQQIANARIAAAARNASVAKSRESQPPSRPLPGAAPARPDETPSRPGAGPATDADDTLTHAIVPADEPSASAEQASPAAPGAYREGAKRPRGLMDRVRGGRKQESVAAPAAVTAAPSTAGATSRGATEITTSQQPVAPISPQPTPLTPKADPEPGKAEAGTTGTADTVESFAEQNAHLSWRERLGFVPKAKAAPTDVPPVGPGAATAVTAAAATLPTTSPDPTARVGSPNPANPTERPVSYRTPVTPASPAKPSSGPDTAVIPAVGAGAAGALAGSAGAQAMAAAKPKVGAARHTRKARLRLSRLDPWSVMKTAFLFSIAAGIMFVVASYAVWGVLNASGLFASVNDVVKSVVSTPGDTTPFRVEEYINTQKVMGVAALIAVVDVLIFTALATLGSFLYNLAATVLGGLEVTLAED